MSWTQLIEICGSYWQVFSWLIVQGCRSDVAMKNRSIWKEMSKEHQPDNYCWLELTHHSDTTWMEKFVSLCAGGHVLVCPFSPWLVCIPAGALLFDHSQGFWLSHSIPHFPSFPERGYLYPSSGKVFGQTALCVTYEYSQLLLIGESMLMKQQAWPAPALWTNVMKWWKQGPYLVYFKPIRSYAKCFVIVQLLYKLSLGNNKTRK